MVEAPATTNVTQNSLEQAVEPQEPIVFSEDTEVQAKEYIYFKESSNRLDAENSIGCKGLGQDCNGVLHLECPNWKTDYACQDNFWEQYMKKRYGTWAKAKAFWESRVPINGKDVGHWW